MNSFNDFGLAEPILRALAVAHLDDAAGAVDVFDPQSRDFGGPESGRIGRSERGAALQAGHGLEELTHFVGAEHDRQLARFSRIGNALRDERLAERENRIIQRISKRFEISLKELLYKTSLIKTLFFYFPEKYLSYQLFLSPFFA